MKEIYPVPDKFKETARISEADYFKRYQHSIEQPEAFWAEEAQKIDWIKPFTQVKNTSFSQDDFRIEWFADGELNVSANCLDRHLKDNPLKPAIIWEGDHPSRHKIISFAESPARKSLVESVNSNQPACAESSQTFICPNRSLNAS